MLGWTRHTHVVDGHVPTHRVLSRTGYMWYVNLHEANIPFIIIGMVTWMCCTCPPQELETEWERQQVQEQLQRNQLERLHDDLRRVNWKLGKEERDTGQCYWIAHVNKTSMVMPLWDDMNSCCKSTERGHFEATTGNQLLGNKLAHNICSILRSCGSCSYTTL